jgi:GT2 family glycosyltransferase
LSKVIDRAKILLLVVNFRSKGSVIETLESIKRARESADVECIVVDNGSDPDELASIRSVVSIDFKTQLLESSTNRGYFGAARFALNYYLEKPRRMPDWLIVCNHDIHIEDRSFFPKLLSRDPGQVGVIAPSIQVLPGKAEQNPFMKRRPGPLRWTKLRFVSCNYAVATVWDWLWRQKAKMKSWRARRGNALQRRGRREFVYAAHGSFLIFSRRFFESGGFLDCNLFLYGEEISVAEICRELSLPIVYEPLLQVLHMEHQSTGKVLTRFTYECQRKAIQYLTLRYRSPSLGPATPPQPDVS